MATATISETLALPAGGSASTLAQTKVRLKLVASNDGTNREAYSTALTVVAESWTKVNSAGEYSFTGVRPNSGASADVITSPANTVYELTVTYPDRSTSTRYISVPDSAGPHAPEDIETVAPDAIVTSPVQAALDNLDRNARLRGLRAALAASASTPVDIVLIGDSVTAGWCGPTEASAMGVTDWPTTFERLIAARAGNTRTPGRGWLPPRSDVILGTYPYGWGNVDRTSGGTVATDGTNDLTSGLGQWGRSLAVGDTLEHTDTCDGLTVYYTAQRTGGANIEVRVDGSLLTTINTTDGTISAGQATDSGRSWTSNALTYGSHAVVLTVAGSGTAIVDGAYFHAGNRASGVRVHKGGHSGYYTGSTWTGTLEHVESVQPACVVVFLGLNDYVYQATPADYEADYETLIDAIATAAPNATVIAIVPPDNYERAWDAWHTAGLNAVAATDAILLDLHAAMGDISDTADPLDLSNDGIHLSSVGSRMLAELVADIILPGPVDRVPVLLADGSRSATGALDLGGNDVTDAAVVTAEEVDVVDNSAKVKLSAIADGPLVELFKTDADTVAAVSLFSSDLLSAAGVQAGAGGSSALDTYLARISAGIWSLIGGGLSAIGKGATFTEQSAPSSPSANNITLYAADNGSGTTVLRTKDAAGTVTTLGAGGGGSYTDEEARDAIGAALVAGEGIDITVSDGSDTITIDAEAASDTNPGIVELATGAETTTGTDAARAVTPDGLAGSEYGVEVVEIMASDMSTAITTGDGKAGFQVPTKLNGWNLIRAHAGLLVAQSSSGTPTIQVRNATQTADMLSTRITIDTNEWTSYTAAVPPVIDAANDDVATGDRILIDLDVAGTGAKGLVVVLEFQLP